MPSVDDGDRLLRRTIFGPLSEGTAKATLLWALGSGPGAPAGVADPVGC